jgi:hypothetical protein
LGQNAAFAGVDTDIQAAGLLIDTLDAIDAKVDKKNKNHTNIVLVNVAPRNGDAKKYENGTPFSYFHYNGTLVVSTVDGHTLSLVKKFKLIDAVHVLDIPSLLPELVKEGIISEKEKERIEETQFRSFEFSPRIALYLSRRKRAKNEERKIEEIPGVAFVAWHVDQFAKYGNVKTTILPEDVFTPDVVEKLKYGKGEKNKIGTLTIQGRTLPVYRRLKDVPNGVLAVVVGSSGFKDKRFLEIVVQGGNAGKELGVSVGDSLLTN